jgi:activator of HSP90 ATPase
MAFEFTVSDVIPASPREIYDAWLSSRGHAQITGGQPATVSAIEGAPFSAWNGYISGRNIKLEPGRRIVQSWRTTEFADADPDSQIEILLEPVQRGTAVTLHHTNIPDRQTAYRKGWQDFYFEPMKTYFNEASKHL